MKHTSLNILRYGSITRHYKTCNRCLKRSANNGCRLGRYLWARYMEAARIEKSIYFHTFSRVPGSIYKDYYHV